MQLLFITWYTDPEIRVRVFSLPSIFFTLHRRWPFVLGSSSRLHPSFCHRGLLLDAAVGIAKIAAIGPRVHCSNLRSGAASVADSAPPGPPFSSCRFFDRARRHLLRLPASGLRCRLNPVLCDWIESYVRPV
jgi:hypothetical protein